MEFRVRESSAAVGPGCNSRCLATGPRSFNGLWNIHGRHRYYMTPLGSPTKRNGLPWWLSGKESTCNADLGSVPVSGRFLWRRASQPTPVFLPRESHVQRSGGQQSMEVTKRRTQWKWLSTYAGTREITTSSWSDCSQNRTWNGKEVKTTHFDFLTSKQSRYCSSYV